MSPNIMFYIWSSFRKNRPSSSSISNARSKGGRISIWKLSMVPPKKTIQFCSTIRDTGRGLARKSDFASRRPEDVPITYEEIKSQCLASGTLWEDPDFPAIPSSIYFKNPPPMWPDVQWKRPGVSDFIQWFVHSFQLFPYCNVLYCIVSIHLYSASCSAHQSEALPVREIQREERSLERTKRGTWLTI